MLASYQTLKRLCEQEQLFEPFSPRTLNERSGKTHGLGPCTYDVTVEFDEHGEIEYVDMLPMMCLLASTEQRFKIPLNYGAFVLDKSTWARHFLTAQNTFVDPGFEGWLTLELVNHSTDTFRIWRGDPIAQIALMQLDEPTQMPYGGKYQAQRRGPVRAIHERFGLQVNVARQIPGRRAWTTPLISEKPSHVQQFP